MFRALRHFVLKILIWGSQEEFELKVRPRNLTEDGINLHALVTVNVIIYFFFLYFTILINPPPTPQMTSLVHASFLFFIVAFFFLPSRPALPLNQINECGHLQLMLIHEKEDYETTKNAQIFCSFLVRLEPVTSRLRDDLFHIMSLNL